jgi:hypothetical protein
MKSIKELAATHDWIIIFKGKDLDRVICSRCKLTAFDHCDDDLRFYYSCNEIILLNVL